MKVEKNNVVALTYELNVDGAIADKATEDRPLEYIHGTHMLLPKFESEVEGKEPGETFAFTLTPEEGYGTVNEEMVIDLPIQEFAIDGKIHQELLQVGRVIPMMNQAGGVVQGTVRAVKEDAVTMDFNHPMAGKTLHFTGAVVSVRAATAKELEEGLHGEYLPPTEKKHCKKHGDGECCHKGDGEGCCKEEGKGCCKDE